MRTVHIVFNAHIDPVWLWPWTAGVDEALNTCYTMCRTLDRHPDNDGNYELGNVRFLPKRLNYSAPSKRDCTRGEQN